MEWLRVKVKVRFEVDSFALARVSSGARHVLDVAID